MRPIFVRTLTDAEQQQLQVGRRSSDAFIRRRCQVVLASANGQRAITIAETLGCDDQTVRNVIEDFNARGLEVLTRRSSRPHTTQAAFSAEAAEQLRDLLHQSPRTFGKPTSLWTLDLAAQVSFEQGLIAEQVSGETIRATLARLQVGWKRAKRWITSPDPAYTRKKTRETASRG